MLLVVTIDIPQLLTVIYLYTQADETNNRQLHILTVVECSEQTYYCYRML